MGMLDPKVFLTGENGVCHVGEVFLLRGAKLTGQVTINGQPRQEAALKIEKENGATIVAHTTGAAIVSQVQRMDDGDREKMRGTGLPVKLVERGGGDGRNPAHVLADPNEPDVEGALSPTDDF